MLNTLFKIKTLLLLSILATVLLFNNSCKKDDEDTKSTATELFSFGPSPVLRGGELKFIGANLDKVTSIVLSDNVSVTSFSTKTPELIVITVPVETVTGYVTLKSSTGDVTTKSTLRISEPISITSFSPAEVRPGGVLTIEGTYLNLIKAVIFSTNKVVEQAAFVSQTQTKIEVNVPADAQTGIFLISNGEADPILLESESELVVTLPTITGVAPTPVKAGANLTISGTNLDLAKDVTFSGGGKVSSDNFVSATAAQIVVTVPANAKDGPIKVSTASFLEVTSTAEVVMLLPTITGIAPNPVKNGSFITATGTNLDLVTKVTFGGEKTGTITSSSATQLVVVVPADATEGAVVFGTAADKSVSSDVLTLIKPTITGVAPLDPMVNDDITITGTNLDLVTKVKFTGDVEANVNSAALTTATVTVPVGATDGPITIITANGTEVVSTESLTVQASTSIVVTNMPASGKPGEMISIVGENMLEVSELIFPENVTATMFGQKTNTLIEVVIPMNAKRGVGRITFITIDGQMVQSPEINIQGVDPVVDPTLVFFNFDNLGSWWGDAGAVENDPLLTVDGTNYFHVNQTCNGWTGYFWRNGSDNFPGSTIGTNVADYVLKYDINVLEDITGGEFAWRLKGSSGDFWYYWKPWESSGSYKTDGWLTISIPLTDFYSGADQITDLSTITEDFGIAFNNGTSLVNACIDNVRFEHK